MMRRYRITHTTSLTYDSPVRASHNELRMTPLNEPGQTTLENRLRIKPLTWSLVYRDHWGTHVTAMESLAAHPRLDVEATSTVERTHLGRAEESLGWEAVRDLEVQEFDAPVARPQPLRRGRHGLVEILRLDPVDETDAHDRAPRIEPDVDHGRGPPCLDRVMPAWRLRPCFVTP